MKKIITAMNNPKLNETLSKIKECEIIAPDIAYQEAVLEILEENQEAQILIISELLTGNFDFIEFIKKIQKNNNNLKIIIILEKENKEKINELNLIGINYILIHNKTTIEETIEIIKNINTEKNIEKEIEEIKKLIIENKTENKIKNKKEKILKKFREKIKEKIKFKKNEEINKNIKMISISGTTGVGKSIITAYLAKELKKQKYKTVILDFDILNNDIITLFGKKKNEKNKKIKLGKKLDLICGTSFLTEGNKINIFNLNNLLEELKKQYEIIIIDTSCECFLNYNQFILEKSDEILFLTEANLLDIKKSIRILKIFQETWKIKKEKIKIIFNKYNKNSVDEKILKNIFYDYEILGKLYFNNKYNLLINKNMNSTIYDLKLKKDYEKIINKILNKEKKLWKMNYY